MVRDRERPALITSARLSRTLDNGQRRTRYLWTMAIRLGCFIAATVSPTPWNLILLLAAAVLPTMAVMLANAVDRRSLPPAPAADSATDRPELTGPSVLPGTVVEE